MVQQIVLPIKYSNILQMVQDTLLDSFRAGRSTPPTFPNSKNSSNFFQRYRSAKNFSAEKFFVVQHLEHCLILSLRITAIGILR